MVWRPRNEAEEEYYSIPAPSDQQSLLSQVLGSSSDPTYGRAALPRLPVELALYDLYDHDERKVVISDKEWITYQVWQAKKEQVESKHTDLLYCHGINDLGGKFAQHAPIFLDKGYRVIALDLPAHGRSTGLHVYLPSLEALADAVYLVLSDVLLQDSKLVPDQGSEPTAGGTPAASTFTQTRKIFVAGQSLGGFVATLTCIKYGSSDTTTLPNPIASRVQVPFRPRISGGLFLCPMLAISPETRPAFLVELVARGISSFAGGLPLAAANKGKNSEDPDIEEEFNRDPNTYHGKLRVGTGLAILKGLTEINETFSNLSIPFLICHGTGDRVVSYKGSQKLLQEANSTDKELKLYEGYEHILLRKGKDEADDSRRQRVLGDMLEWLERH